MVLLIFQQRKILKFNKEIKLQLRDALLESIKEGNKSTPNKIAKLFCMKNQKIKFEMMAEEMAGEIIMKIEEAIEETIMKFVNLVNMAKYML